MNTLLTKKNKLIMIIFQFEKISSKQIINSNYDFKNLSEIADFIRGITFSKNDRLQKETNNSIKIELLQKKVNGL